MVVTDIKYAKQSSRRRSPRVFTVTQMPRCEYKVDR